MVGHDADEEISGISFTNIVYQSEEGKHKNSAAYDLVTGAVSIPEQMDFS